MPRTCNTCQSTTPLAFFLAVVFFSIRQLSDARELRVGDGFGLVAGILDPSVSSVLISSSELVLREDHWDDVSIPVLLERNLTLRGDPAAPGPPLFRPAARNKVRQT